MKISYLELCSHRMNELKQFYSELLEMKLLEETESSFAVAAGTTELRFTAAAEQSQPFYHFAFNIPENKVEEARDWFSHRVHLLLDEGESIVHFESWNAHSFYFYDPAGNIVECIGRHTLNNGTQGPFQPKDILCVSEIGLPVEDVLETVEDMERALGIQPWREPRAGLTPVGDEHGLLIFVEIGRTWFMTTKQASPSPVKLTICGDKEKEVHLSEYELHMVKAEDQIK